MSSETWEQLINRQLREVTLLQELHIQEISNLYKAQEKEIPKSKGLTPALQEKFKKQLEDLKSIHRGIATKQYERHEFERDTHTREHDRQKTTEGIIKSAGIEDYQTRDEIGDKDDFDKE